MQVIVLGAGVTGLTTAWYLAERGARVTVVDSAGDAGLGATCGNAAQLSYSYTDSLATPDFVRRIPGLFVNSDPAVRVRMDPGLIGWGIEFLRNCTKRRATDNTLSLLDVSMRSAELMDELRSRVSFDFSHRKAGKLVLVSDQAGLRKAERLSALKRQRGCSIEVLTPAEARSVEPALDALATEYVAAVWSESDELADSLKFTQGLRHQLAESGRAEFLFNENVDRFIVEDSRIVGAGGSGEHRGDAVVVCAGAWSGRLLKQIGIRARIRPMRGYSITLPPGDGAPSASITSLKHRIAISRIDSRLRVSGFADFRGFDTSRDDERLGELLSISRRIAPAAADYDAEGTRWGGFRPMTPNGLPLVGGTHIPGLYLNTGHGMLGWTLACATGEAAASAVMGEQQ